MLFFRPTALHRRLEPLGLLEVPTELTEFVRPLRNPLARRLVLRGGLLLLLMMIGAGAIPVFLAAAMGQPVPWSLAARLTAIAAGFGVLVGFSFGAGFGVVVGALLGVLLGVLFGVLVVVRLSLVIAMEGVVVNSGVMLGMTLGAVLSVALNVAGAVAGGKILAPREHLALWLATALGCATVASVTSDGNAISVTLVAATLGAFIYSLFAFHLPMVPLEALWMVALRLLLGWGLLTREHCARVLPFRHHDFIYFPLPFLRQLLVSVGSAHPELGATLLVEAAETPGQSGVARLAALDLHAQSLVRAAQERQWEKIRDLSLPFLPDRVEPGSSLEALQLVAMDLQAAMLSRDYHHRGETLRRAERRLDGLIYRNTSDGHAAARRELSVTRAWLAVVAEERRKLEQDQRERPRVPRPFVAGPPLRQRERELFKGRRDLLRLIDTDLVQVQRMPLLLYGQRRMGKSSLLEMLPERLGTRIHMARVDFQGLSGEPWRTQPHRLVARAVERAVGQVAPFDLDSPWRVTLDWLVMLESSLAERGERVLVAVDEVERLEGGIREGWADTSFLDFVRAMGDQLNQLRVLLVGAVPLEHLGRHWTDRLVSVLQREIGFLEASEAIELIRHPSADFPDIYPCGGVERILGETNGHPYLIQLVCGELCDLLNERNLLRATVEDIEHSFDKALTATALFSELYGALDSSAQKCLIRLTIAPVPTSERDSTLKRLVLERFVKQTDGHYRLSVPLFERWLREFGPSDSERN